VEEVDGKRAGGLCAQELAPAGLGAWERRRWDAVELEDRRIVGAPMRRPSFEQLASIRI
jgi:hypothetical protein